MLVRAIWEFDADVSDIDPMHVNKKGLSKDLAHDALQYYLERGELSADDFRYEIQLELGPKTYSSNNNNNRESEEK